MDLQLLREYALKLVGTPYRFGGKTPLDGIDCSGLVGEILKAAGVLHTDDDRNAQSLHDGLCLSLKTKNLILPELGSVVFYGQSTDKITHVVFCLDEVSALGADGGRAETVTLDQAVASQAFVKIRPIKSACYRVDVVAIIQPDYS